MSEAIRNKTELLLALLVSDGIASATPSPIVGITRLEKLVFLLKVQEHLLAEVPKEDDFHFVPFRMGPWTEEVYDEVDFLESLGLVEKSASSKHSAADAAHDEELFSEAVLTKYQRESTPNSEEVESFRLSKKGLKKAREIWQRLPKSEQEKIMRIKRQFNSLNLNQLLRYVYNKYPEYTTESEIKKSLGL